jgi:hypothetical protein
MKTVIANATSTFARASNYRCLIGGDASVIIEV